MYHTGRRGPHSSSILEQGLNSLHLPYSLACALFAILIGPIGQFIALVLDTHNISTAANDSFGIAFSGVPYPTFPVAVLANLAFLLLLFSGLYLIRYVRVAIVNAEQDLAPLQPEGEDMYDHVFRWLSIRSFPVLLSLPFFLFSIYYLYYSLIPQGSGFGITYLAYVIIASTFSALAFSTFIWTFATALLGLYNFGKRPLKLKPYINDRMLGLGPVGSLSLALTRSYFLAALLLAFTVLISPDPASLALTIAIIVMGILFFFLPLKTCHDKLSDAKSKIHGEISDELSALMRTRDDRSTTDVSNGLTDIKSIMILQMAEERARSIPAWPLDTPALGKFTLILVSVSAALISRVIISYLRL